MVERLHAENYPTLFLLLDDLISSDTMVAVHADVETFLNSEPSLVNGGGKDFTAGTAHSYLQANDKVDVVISDVRGRESDFSLDQHGFEFHKHKSSERDFIGDKSIKQVLYNETVDLLKDK